MRSSVRQRAMISKVFAAPTTGGYAAASIIDDLFEHLLREHPISSCPDKWMGFARTILTSTLMLERVAISEFKRPKKKG